MSRPRTEKGNTLITIAANIQNETPIEKVCKVCGKEQEVKGVTWEDIAEHLNIHVKDSQKSTPIAALCAPCAYKVSRVGIEPTQEQIEKRRASSLKRQNEIKEALALLRQKRNGELDSIIDGLDS